MVSELVVGSNEQDTCLEITKFAFSTATFTLDPFRTFGVFLARGHFITRHNCMRNMGKLTARIAALPPIPRIINNLEKFPANHAQFFFVVCGPWVSDLNNMAASALEVSKPASLFVLSHSEAGVVLVFDFFLFGVLVMAWVPGVSWVPRMVVVPGVAFRVNRFKFRLINLINFIMTNTAK